jgi:hypothetical protein
LSLLSSAVLAVVVIHTPRYAFTSHAGVGGGGGGGGVTEPPPPLEQEARKRQASIDQNTIFLYMNQAIKNVSCCLKLINNLYLPSIVIKFFN